MNAKVACGLFLVTSLILLGGCGGGGGSGSSIGTGTVSLDIADAKPFIEGAEQPDELWIVFESVFVHTSGGGWVSLDLPRTSFEINLLAFYDGRTTEFATPTLIPAGHITQIRFEISRAWMVFPNNSTEEIDLGVPSGTLRTDKQIDWSLPSGGAISLTVHFDLSQSIVLAGGTYKLKPVLHLFNNDPVEAATICGSITPESFVVGDPLKVDVFVDLESARSGVTETQTYTHVTVFRESETDPTYFCIYWLVPLDADEDYNILIDNGDGVETNDYSEVVRELESGVTVELKGGEDITISSVN